MSNVYSLILSARVNNTEPFGNVYRVNCTHLDRYNTFQFDLVTAPGMMPPSKDDKILIFDAIPLNSTETPDGYVHDQRLIATNRTRIIHTNSEDVVNKVFVSGRLGDDAITRTGSKSNGDTYKLTRFKTLSNYWNGKAEATFSFQCSYWKAELKGLLKGNGVIVSGQLKSELNANDQLTYFNLNVYDFDYGQASQKNSVAA